MTERMDLAMGELRDALQRAADGESPDSIVEELRQTDVCCEHHTVCQGLGVCKEIHA